MTKENGWRSMADAPVSATVKIARGQVSSNYIEEMIEFSRPSELNEITPLQNVVVPLRSLQHLLRSEGTPVSRDRESAINVLAGIRARAYTQEIVVDLPPELHGELGAYLTFPADYILQLVADDVAISSEERSARLRQLAADYYATDEEDHDDWEPSQEENEAIVAALESFVAG